MTRTTINKLRRVHEMREARIKGETWYVNPYGHPEPTLPGEEHLRRTYLGEVARSNPGLLPKAVELIQYVLGGKEKRG